MPTTPTGYAPVSTTSSGFNPLLISRADVANSFAIITKFEEMPAEYLDLAGDMFKMMAKQRRAQDRARLPSTPGAAEMVCS